MVVYYVFTCSVGIISSDSGLFHVDVIVLDEVHYLSDISRGTVWEEIVSTIFCPPKISFIVKIWFSHFIVIQCNRIFQVIYCPKEVQLICLSATVANPDELAGWIGQVLFSMSCPRLNVLDFVGL